MNAKEAKLLTNTAKQKIQQTKRDIWLRHKDDILHSIKEKALEGKTQMILEFRNLEMMLSLDLIISELENLGYTVKKGAVVTVSWE